VAICGYCDPRSSGIEQEADMKRAAAAFLVAGAVTVGLPAFAESIDVHKAFVPKDIQWSASTPGLPAGAESATLYGDPQKPGAFALRLKLAKGYKIPPHMHKSLELVTVISGEIRLGLGQAADHASVETLPAGSFSSMPPGVVHYVLVDQDAVVQVEGSGPFDVEYPNAKDDPRLNRSLRPDP
jgi:quercetin dioxygenase-like cupin family protein